MKDGHSGAGRSEARQGKQVSNLYAKLGEAKRRLGDHAGIYESVMVLTIALGLFLRVNSWLGHHISLWFDESLWAMRLLHRPITELSIRPIGFMWVTRLFVEAFGATEVWLRLLPAVGALASMLLFPYVAGRLLRSPLLRLLAVLLFAIHPALVDYANEFKPYSWEVLMHLVPIALYLRYRETDHRRWLYALLGYLPVAFLFAYNLAFVFPGTLLLCLSLAWRSNARKQLLGATFGAGFACLASLGLMFHLTLKHVTHGERTEDYWGGKYHVFYQDKLPESRVDWTLERYDDMAAFVGIRRTLWSQYGGMDEEKANELGSLDRYFWIVMSFAGVVALWRTRRDLLWVLWAPLLTMMLANFLGKWPLGAFRTNVFIMVYVLPLAMLGMQALATNRPRSLTLGAMVLAFTLVPGFAYGFDLHGHKRLYTRDHFERQVLAKLYAYRTQQLKQHPGDPPLLLLLEPHTYSPYSYYLHDHPEFGPKYRAFFEKNFVAKKVNPGALVTRLGRWLRHQPRGMWIVSSSRKDLDSIERRAPQQARVVVNERIADQHVIMFLKPKVKGKPKR